MTQTKSFSLLASVLFAFSFTFTTVAAQDTESPGGNDRIALRLRVEGLVNEGNLKGAIDALETLLSHDVEHSSDQLQLETVDWMARLAHGLLDPKREVEYRTQALKLGKRIYPAGSYQLKDLQLDLLDAQADFKRSLDELKQLEEIKENLFIQFRTANYQGDHETALKLAIEIRDQYKSLLGKEHRRYLTSVNDLGVAYYLSDELAKALTMLHEALPLVEKVYGTAHPTHADALRRLATLESQMGLRANANEHLAKACETYLEIYRAEPSVLVDRVSLANDAFRRISAYGEGLRFLQEARKLIAADHGAEHCDVIRCDAFVSFNLLQSGPYEQAKNVCARALLSIRKKARDTCDPKVYGNLLNNHATASQELGQLDSALVGFREAMSERKRVFGTEHSMYGQSLNNLAGVLFYLGDNLKAKQHYKDAIEVLAPFGETKDLAQVMVNLANVHMRLHEHSDAAELLVEARRILKNDNTASPLMLAAALNSASAVMNASGNNQKAIKLLREAKAIYDAELSSDNPESYIVTLNIASNVAELDELEEAENLVSGLISKIEQESKSQFRLEAKTQLAVIQQKGGDNESALTAFRQILTETRRNFAKNASLMSGRQQLAAASDLRYRLDNFVNACLISGTNDLEATQEILQWKGTAMIRQRQVREAMSDPKFAADAQRLNAVVAQLSSRSRSSQDKKSEPEVSVSQLVLEKDKLEARLSAASMAVINSTEGDIVRRLQDALPSDTALVVYLECETASGGDFVASVIRRDADPKLIHLGSASAIENNIAAWLSTQGEGDEAVDAGQKLRGQIWEPLGSNLKGVQTVLVSPDTALGRFPFLALPGEAEESYLIDDFRLVLCPVPAMLLEQRKTPAGARSTDRALVVGGVDYSRSPQPLWSEGGSDTEAGTWPALPATVNEAALVEQLFRKDWGKEQVGHLSSTKASESAICENLLDSRFVHLATHGFFATPDVSNALAIDSIKKSRSGIQRIGLGKSEQITGWNPGQLSGLVFAGETSEAVSDKAGRPIDDGLLTADEVSLLDLQGTELVVLSACETGLGKVAGGEGLLGIQRAFQVAGAQSTVASLWKVDDNATKVLMTLFYENLLEKKMSKADSLRAAQLWMLDHPREVFDPNSESKLRAPGRKKLSTSSSKAGGDTETKRLSPKYWAAFSLSGDWN